MQATKTGEHKRVDIRRNDTVKVITGRDKGKQGRVLQVLPDHVDPDHALPFQVPPDHELALASALATAVASTERPNMSRSPVSATPSRET